MAYDLTGKVKVIGDVKTISDKFSVREFVVTVEDGNYPQDIALQFVNDKVSLLDTVQVDQEVTVTFDIRGRQSKDGRYFNNLSAWKIQTEAPTAAAPASDDRPPLPADSEAPGELDDDIPF